MAKAKISKTDFDALRGQLEADISSRLAEETNRDEFSPSYVDSGAATDLWELPTVPSKAVVKISGIVERTIGVKLPTKFIRSGGYNTLEEAVEHVCTQLRTICTG